MATQLRLRNLLKVLRKCHSGAGVVLSSLKAAGQLGICHVTVYAVSCDYQEHSSAALTTVSLKMWKQENQQWLHNHRVLFCYFKAEGSESSHSEGLVIACRILKKEGGRK